MKALKNFYANKGGKVKFYKQGDEVDADNVNDLLKLGLVEKDLTPAKEDKNGKPRVKRK